LGAELSTTPRPAPLSLRFKSLKKEKSRVLKPPWVYGRCSQESAHIRTSLKYGHTDSQSNRAQSQIHTKDSLNGRHTVVKGIARQTFITLRPKGHSWGPPHPTPHPPFAGRFILRLRLRRHFPFLLVDKASRTSVRKKPRSERPRKGHESFFATQNTPYPYKEPLFPLPHPKGVLSPPTPQGLYPFPFFRPWP